MTRRLGMGALAVVWFLSVGRGEPVGTLAELGGQVQVAPQGGNPAPAQQGGTVQQGDRITTGPAPAFVQVHFTDKSVVKLGPNTELVITLKGKQEVEGGLFRKTTRTVDATILDLNIGEALFKVEGFKKRTTSFEVRTPNAVAGVRGTLWREIVEQLAQTLDFDTEVIVTDGHIRLGPRNAPTRLGRWVIVRENRQSSVTGNSNPTRPGAANPGALRPGLDFHQQTSGTGGTGQGDMSPQEILDLLRRLQMEERRRSQTTTRQEGALRQVPPPGGFQKLPGPPPPP